MEETPEELRARQIKELKCELAVCRLNADLIEERARKRRGSWAFTLDARELARRKKSEYNTCARVKAARMEGGAVLELLRELEDGSPAEIAARIKAELSSTAAPTAGADDILAQL